MVQIAEQVKGMFEAQGFRVTRSKTVDGLLQLATNPLVLCSDGRRISGTVFPYQDLGPKVLGGTPGEANFYAAAKLGFFKNTTFTDLDRAIYIDKKNGMISGFHDIGDHEVHCGEQGKMQKKEIHTLPKQIYTPQEAKTRILSAGGEGVNLLGSHMESNIIVNLVEWTTRAPDGTSFMEDVWWMLNYMNIPAHIIVAASAEIIKKLTPVRELVVVG